MTKYMPCCAIITQVVGPETMPVFACHIVENTPFRMFEVTTSFMFACHLQGLPLHFQRKRLETFGKEQPTIDPFR